MCPFEKLSSLCEPGRLKDKITYTLLREADNLDLHSGE